MMAIADQQNRRRARHQQYQSEQARNLAGLIGAVDDVGEEADADAMAKAKAEAAAGDTSARKTQAEAALLRAKTAAGANADAILRKKTDDSAKIAADEAKAAKLAREESVLRRKSSEDTLRTRLETGTPGATPIIDDPALEELDDDAVRTIEAQVAAAKAAEAEKKRAADAKIAADEALAGQRNADAEKKRRAPSAGGSGKPPSPDAALRSELLRLDVAKARNEAAGGPGSSVDKAKTATAEKKKQQVLEVENFTSNIDSNIEAVKDMIAKTGTFELTGPESQIMDRRLTEIATDLAKLADPGSVARNEEVELQRGNLLASGWRGLLTKDKTAQQVLDVLREDVKKRRAKAYKVRGLDPPDSEPTSKPAAPASAADTSAADDFFSSP